MRRAWTKLSAHLTLVAALAGCRHSTPLQADLSICELATKPLDQHAEPPDSRPLEPIAQTAAVGVDGGQQLPPPRTLADRMRIPAGVPGASVPPIEAPSIDASAAERQAAYSKLYPMPPNTGGKPQAAPAPDGRAYSLENLQRLATTNSPNLRQSAAEVDAARGAAVQAGLYPNPVVGYEADTMHQARSNGLQGGFIEQTFKTAGKLRLAQAAALVDVQNAELSFRRAQADLASKVRAGYFAVLVAQEAVRVNEALVEFADEIYRIQVDQVRDKHAAPYEPFQVRVLAYQARAQLVQAHNRQMAAWKGLAASMGLPGMPLSQLRGTAEQSLPAFDYETTLARVLQSHTDVLSAQNDIAKARFNLELAQVTPVPDLDVRVMTQKDNTTPPYQAVTSLVMGIKVPVWDRNQGNIQQAEGRLLIATEQSHRVRSELTSRLADAFARYENARQVLVYYRENILPDQVRAYRGVYARHEQDAAEVSFPDVVTAQQTLAGAVLTYVTTLGEAWNAVVELGNLLQTEDLYLGQSVDASLAATNWRDLLGLPCCHPCSPALDPNWRGADPAWPKR